MRIKHNGIGKVNNRLTQVGPQFEISKYRWYAVYKCCCGNHIACSVGNATCGQVKSCGCLAREILLKRNKSHGMSHTRVYHIWEGILKRCRNKTKERYRIYRETGVCDRWLVFENFYEDMGNPPSDDYSIDRIDNSKGYCPENCRWATEEQQQRNKTNNFMITAFGRTMCSVEWEPVYGIPASLIRQRIRILKWDNEKAVSFPVRKY